jgi:hypothetical protein
MKYFDKKKSITVDNHSFKVHKRRYGKPNLLTLLEIYTSKADRVSIYINDSLKFQVTYKDSDIIKKKIFDGQFNK